MSRTTSIDITIDDIEKQLQKYSWISSYEVYHQTFSKLKAKVKLDNTNNDIPELQKIRISGFAVRYITKTHHLIELSLGISHIKLLSDLSPPKSTHVTNPHASFQQLKKPKKSSIVGDDFKSTNLIAGTVTRLMNDFKSLLNEEVISGSEITFEMEKETIQIVNSNSKLIQMKNLRSNLEYQFTYDISPEFILIKDSQYRRNLDFNYHKLIENVSDSVSSKLMPYVKIDPHNLTILLHPEVLGRIIAFQSTIFLSDPPVTKDQIWNENLYLYDDPLRENGYQSCLIDDEGSETKSKTLIENGIHVRGLDTLQETTWKEGGNAFRNMWFEPVKHSFEYALRKDATNLVVSGGTGRGELFNQSSELTIYVKKGHGYIGGIATNPYFVIHSSETEVWKNGELIGPTRNYTLSGSLLDIMKYGDLSSDEFQVIDRAIPSAVYIGWLRIPSGKISIG